MADHDRHRDDENDAPRGGTGPWPTEPFPGRYDQQQYAQSPQHGQASYGQPQYGQPQYGQPQYGQQPYGQVPPGWTVARPTNGLAIASLVLGILWIYWLGSVLAPVSGYVARSQIRQRGEGGGGLATAGTVLGRIGVGLLAFRAAVPGEYPGRVVVTAAARA